MKKLLLVCVFLMGCVIPLTHEDRLATSNRVNILDQWINKATDTVGSITLVVANPTYKNVFVSATCEFISDGDLFGVSEVVEIEAGTKKQLMVRGFLRDNDGKIKCVLHND